ncbi:MAG: hypothetical protein GKR86_08845 [Ilumatobacter sp.]|nr:hypothetical protein [Ilumatobacter sp.]
MSTKSSTRIKLVALAAAITGSLVFVSEVQAQPDPTPVPAVLESLERQTAELNAGAASVFVPIPSFRAYDTREFGGKFPRGNPVSVFVGSEYNGETFGVPVDATAVTFNVTAVDTENRGYIQVFNEEGTSPGDTSTVNWTQTGQNIANSGTVALTRDNPFNDDVVGFEVYVGGPENAKTHILIDITGYYIPAS